MKAVFNAFAYPSEKYNDYLFNYQDVIKAIRNRESFKTNHMFEMSSCWDYEEYDIYLVAEDGQEYLLANDGVLTMKDLRPAHNIHKMWRAGSFCDLSKNRNMRFTMEK